ncbi:MAG: TetR/AcrR family transcriptional regulator [Smithellaceae bacterium]
MDRRETIIFHARKQFTRFGYTKTTMDDIARKCDITKPTLYQYYTGKADLFAAVINDEQMAFFEMIEQATNGISEAAGKMYAYADVQIASIRKFLLLGELSRRALLDLHPEALKVMAVCRAQEEALLAGWIEQGIRSGEFASQDASHAARVFFLALVSLKFQTLVLDNPGTDEIKAEEAPVVQLAEDFRKLVDLFLNGLRVRGENA